MFSSLLKPVSVVMLPGPLPCFAMSRSTCLAQESWTQLDLETEFSLSVSREEIRPWRKWSFICSKSGGKFRRGDYHGLCLGRETQSETLWHIKLYSKAIESFTTLKLTFWSPLTRLWNPSLTRFWTSAGTGIVIYLVLSHTNILGSTFSLFHLESPLRETIHDHPKSFLKELWFKFLGCLLP